MERKIVEVGYDNFLDCGTWYVLKTNRDWEVVFVDVYQGSKRTHTRKKIKSLSYGIGFIGLVNDFIKGISATKEEILDMPYLGIN